MVKTIETVYDGKVLRPADPLVLEPNIRMRLTIETVSPVTEGAGAFLRVARSLNLDGPADGAANLKS
jgi:hypothetical protein